jgi:hypothetical protein
MSREMRSGAHALVVGGTGMLRSVSLDLAARGMEVSVVARSADRLRRLAADAEGTAGAIHPVALDYRDTDRLLAALAAAHEARGPISPAVLWIHAVASEAPAAVVGAIASPDDPPRLFHLRGSAARDPSASADPIAHRLREHPGIRYREVVLGFTGRPGRTRWLTDAEISDGVIRAIEDDAARAVIGRVAPWSERPGG